MASYNCFGSGRRVLALGALALSACAGAQELVTNGGFETGTFSGWTLGGDANAVIDGGPVHTGNFAAKLTPGSSTNTVSQDLLTVPGQTYVYSLWLDHEGGDLSTNLVAIDWNGSAVPGSPTALPGSTGWVNYVYNVTATASSTPILIEGHDPAGNIFLDDVSVQAVPEPMSLCGLGLGAALFLRRRKRA